MSSIVPPSYPRPFRPKRKRPSYGTAVAWIAQYAKGESTDDVHMTERLVASLFGCTVDEVVADVDARRLKEQH